MGAVNRRRSHSSEESENFDRTIWNLLKVPMLGHCEAWGSPVVAMQRRATLFLGGKPGEWKTGDRQDVSQSFGPTWESRGLAGRFLRHFKSCLFPQPSIAKLCDERPLLRISESACSLHARGLCYQFAATDPGASFNPQLTPYSIIF